MTCRLALAAIGVAALFQGRALAADDFTEVARTPEQVKRGDECDHLHAELRQKYPDNPQALRDGWVALKGRCAGTGIYEVLLGHDERRAGNVAAAAAVFKDSVNRKLPFYEDSFVALNSIRAEAAFQAQPRDLKRLRVLRDELAKFADGHKADAFAYQQLAAMDIGLEDWPAAVDAARKSLAVDSTFERASRYLVVALHASQRCPEAVKEIRPAIARNPALSADEDFVIPAADCYAEAGNPQAGQAALQELLQKNPAATDDPRVAQLQEYFAAWEKSRAAPQ